MARESGEQMKVVITIEDVAGDANISIGLNFDPPITDDTEQTPASALALRIMRMLEGEGAKGETLEATR